MSERIAIILSGISYCETYRHADLPSRNINEMKIDYRDSIDNYRKYLYKYFLDKGFEIDFFISTNPSTLSEELINCYNPKDYIFVDDYDKSIELLRSEEWANEIKKYSNNVLNELKNLPIIEKNIEKANPATAIEKYSDGFKLYKLDSKELDVFKRSEIWGPAGRIQRTFKPIMGLELCINYSKQHNIQYKNIVMTRFDLTFKIDFNTCKIDLDAINIVSQTEGCMGLCDNLYIIPFRNSIEFLNALKMNILNNPHKLEPYFNKINKINFIYNEKKNIKDLSFYSINRSSKF